MIAHETLPYEMQNYIKEKQLIINYVDFENIYGALSLNKIHIKDKMHLYDQRSTIAHELGHHEQGSVYALDTKFTCSDKVERDADNYAMEELLPEDKLKEKLHIYKRTLCQLEVYFGVRREVIEKRIRALYT